MTDKGPPGVDEPQADKGHVTMLLQAWQRGDGDASERLAPLIYDDLRRLAHRQLRREGARAPLSPTELVHESYLRLVDQSTTFANRTHFLALAATVMRRILVDQARRRDAGRRGGPNLQTVALEDVEGGGTPRSIDVIALDQALAQLGELDARQARIVELHFFGGVSFEDVAAMLDVSASTVFREWRTARLWLLTRLSGATRGR